MKCDCTGCKLITWISIGIVIGFLINTLGSTNVASADGSVSWSISRIASAIERIANKLDEPQTDAFGRSKK